MSDTSLLEGKKVLVVDDNFSSRQILKDILESFTFEVGLTASDEEELHGLYEAEEGEKAVITVWMKTAAKGQVVAFKSFIRTILHELCHHIDYTCFELA